MKDAYTDINPNSFPASKPIKVVEAKPSDPSSGSATATLPEHQPEVIVQAQSQHK